MEGQRLRLALLGADAATVSLVKAAFTDSRFALVGTCELDRCDDPRLVESLSGLLERIRRFDSWEALLDQQQVDAVIVARDADQDRRAEQLRKLIQAGVPVIAAHPVLDSMLVCYELDMIRRETQSVVLPLLADRHHPAIRALAQLAHMGDDSPLGKIEQMTIQRGTSRLSRSEVEQQFARDVDLIRAVAGDMTRLGAMAGGTEQPDYGSLGVQMSGPLGAVGRWNVLPAPTEQGATIMLVGTKGKAIAHDPADGAPWTLEQTIGGEHKTEHYLHWNPAGAALDQLAAAMCGEETEPNWVDAARSVELTETIARSLTKGRTIELYYEDYTEEGTFKGTMASLGCGLLLAALLLLGVVAIVEQLGAPVKLWPYLLVAVLGGFLLLQLLMLVFGGTSRDSQKPPAADEPFSSGS